MLKVNVGLSRKLSRDYNSTGFSLNLEGEVCFGPDDPERAIEKIKELYDLAEEALNQQIERHTGETAIAGRDEEPPSQRNGLTEGRHLAGAANDQNGTPRGSNGDRPQGTPPAEAATNKQVQYLLNIGKRQGLTPQQLETRIERMFGRQVGVYQLTKREAGEIIDSLNQGGNGASNSTSGRSPTNRN
jgi:hypothetical protein